MNNAKKLKQVQDDLKRWKEQAEKLATICVIDGKISRGKFAQIMQIDRSDVDTVIDEMMGKWDFS